MKTLSPLRPFRLMAAVTMIATAGLALPAAAGDSDGCMCTGSKTKTAFDKDREAILAQAGDFRVKFQFQETVGIDPEYQVKDPYTAGATEFVELVEDRGDRIILQHVLVMSDPEDPEAEPRVVKHWRQDWVYQDTEMLEYRGNRLFEKVTMSPDEVEGTWTQAVYQVDDSPRYESIGKWTHVGDRSSWESAETWRPLPRREHSKRDDYQVLVAKNRHTITPSGWVHEQDNYKLVLDDDGQPERVIAHESGLNVYDQVDDVDFSAGRAYWDDTAVYWSDVREMWLDAVDRDGVTHVAVTVDGKPVFAHLFGIANEVREAGVYGDDHRQQARSVILAAIAEEPSAAAN
ncbi:MAG: DUF6607 family protein [Planctomycetota bacterium]